jgi:hypothetical protein
MGLDEQDFNNAGVAFIIMLTALKAILKAGKDIPKDALLVTLQVWLDLTEGVIIDGSIENWNLKFKDAFAKGISNYIDSIMDEVVKRLETSKADPNPDLH